MPTISVSKHFECSPQMAFDVISDFPNAPDFIDGIKKIQMLTDGPVAVGTRIKETRIIMGREGTEEMEVTQLDAPEKLVVEAYSHGTAYVTTYDVAPDGDEASVTLTFTGTPKTLIAKILSALFSKMISSVADMLEKDLIAASEEAKRRAQAN